MPGVSSDPRVLPTARPARPASPEALRRRMLWLLGLTFAHVFGEGGLALWEAVRTGSLALLAFGIESVIEGGAAFLAVLAASFGGPVGAALLGGSAALWLSSITALRSPSRRTPSR